MAFGTLCSRKHEIFTECKSGYHDLLLNVLSAYEISREKHIHPIISPSKAEETQETQANNKTFNRYIAFPTMF